MVDGRRADGEQYAARLNASAELVAAGVGVAEAVRVLAGRFGISQRQARRYVDRAAAGGPVQAPQATVVFTVKLPAELAARVRAQARASSRTISGLVAQALEELLSRGRRKPPGG